MSDRFCEWPQCGRTFEKNSSSGKRWKKAVSAAMASVMLIFTLNGYAGAENVLQTETEGIQAESNLSESAYGHGYVCMYFPESACADPVKVPVLFREETEEVWVDGEAFAEHFNDYGYAYFPEEKTASIQSGQRTAAFQADNELAAYSIGEWECFYQMRSCAVVEDDTFWIPAEPFFYFLGIRVQPVIGQLEDGSWDVQNDFLYVTEPADTIPDILLEIFMHDNGQQWMFTYEKDFGFDEEAVADLMVGAKVVLGVYGTLSGDFERIHGWTSDLTAFVSERICRIFDEDFEDIATFYNTMRTEQFLERMLNISNDQLDALEEQINQELEVSEVFAERQLTALEKLLNYDAAEIAGQLRAITSGDFPVLGKRASDSFAESMQEVLDGLQASGSAIDISLNLLSALITMDSIRWKIEQSDETMIRAVNCYLTNSRNDSELGSAMYGELQLQMAEHVSKFFYAMDEAVEYAMAEIVPDIVLKAAGLSMIGIATAGTNLIVYLKEESGVLPWLVSTDQLEALELAMYSMTYQADAWRELVSSYDRAVLIGGITDSDKLQECALLALNYLKACYVATEAGMKSWENSEHFDETFLPASKNDEVFTESNRYMQTQEKLHTLGEMIDALTQAIGRGESYLSTGVLIPAEEENPNLITKTWADLIDLEFGQMQGELEKIADEAVKAGEKILDGFMNSDGEKEKTRTVRMTYERFLHPADLPVETVCTYEYEVLNEPEFMIWPLVREEKEAVNNGGSVVKYGEELYYWEMEHVSRTGYDMIFSAEEGMCLMRKAADGTKTRIMQTGEYIPLSPSIYILNDRIYINGEVPTSGIYSCDLTGGNVKRYDGRIIAVDETLGYLVSQYDRTVSIINSKDGSTQTILSNGIFDIMEIQDGRIWFASYDDSTREILVESIKEDGTERKLLSKFVWPDDAMYYRYYDSRITGETLYTVWRMMSPRATWIDDAMITSISLDGGDFTVLCQETSLAAFLVNENAQGDVILYYDIGISGDTEIHWDDTVWTEGPVGYMNLNTGENGQKDMPLASVGDPFGYYDRCVMYTDTSDEYATLISARALKEYGIAKLGMQSDGSYVILDDVELVDDNVYFRVVRASENGYYGSNVIFSRGKCELCCYRPELDAIELIYEY